MDEKRKHKLIISAISALLFAIVLVAYFLDDSLDWNATKIVLLVIVEIFAISILPSLRFGYLYLKRRAEKNGIANGYLFFMGLGLGTLLAVIGAPVFAVCYYFLLGKFKD